MLKSLFKKIIIVILEVEARLVLKKYKPSIIAVTGSVGKTGTKDAIYEVVASAHHARKSQKSYNSELGVPLTILGLETGWNSPRAWIINCIKGFFLIVLKNHYPQWLVLEVGVDRPGDMARIARWLKPNIVVITRFADIPPHVEFFESPEDVYEEKWQLVLSLKKNGTLIINGDDPRLLLYAEDEKNISVRTYGLSPASAVHPNNLSVTYSKKNIPEGVSFSVQTKDEEASVHLKDAIGTGHVYGALAALSVGECLKISLSAGALALNNRDAVPGRMRLLSGIHESIIIDDTYNASPEALALALSALYEIENTGNKILVLGDMLELGKFTHEAHTNVGELLSTKLSLVILVGPRARFVVAEKKGGLRKNQIIFCETAEEAGEILAEKVKKGDAVLLKGSQRIRLEKAIKYILTNKDDARYLVRQDEEWERR